MSRFRSTSISALLAVAVLALGACGGDDEGSQDSANTGADTAATTGTTDTGTTTTGTNDTGTTERERTERTETTERKRKRKSGSDDSSGSGDGNSGSGGGGNAGSDAEKQLTGKTVFTTSKTVCSQFLPTALAKDLKDGDKSAEEIAKQYSSGYPAAERKRAYDGCLAGLKTRD